MQLIKHLIVISAVSGLGLVAGCSKEESTAAGSQEQAASAQAPTEKPVVKAAPMVDVSRYLPFTSENAVYSFHAAAGEPWDYETIASGISKEYAYNRDPFAKRDLLEKLKPEIDATMPKYKENPYLLVTYRTEISSYDFATKAFAIPQLADPEFTLQYQPADKFYLLKFNNNTSFKEVKVEDEAAARAIQSALQARVVNLSPGDGGRPGIRLYVAITGLEKEPNATMLGTISKIELIGPNDEVLAAQ